MTVRKSHDAQDTAIVEALRQVSLQVATRAFFVEEIMPAYGLKAAALKVPALHPATVTRRLEKLARQKVVVLSHRRKQVQRPWGAEELGVKAFRVA